MRIALYVSRYPGEEVKVPPSLQYLAGYLIQADLAKDDEIIFADTVEQIVSFNPQIVGVGAVSQTFQYAVEMARTVKTAIPNCLTILGGYHITALPSCLPSVFDIGVLGEGENTLSEIVSLMLTNGTLDAKLLGEIKGICFHDQSGQVTQTPRRELIRNIDALQPLRRLPHGQEWAYLFSARGCPYHCMYCASHSFWHSYRFHSAEYVVNEIQALYAEFGITSIYSVDDLFIAPKKRLLEIRKLLGEKELIGKLRFKGFVRVNLVDEEVITVLKEIGFVELRFGMETASEKLLSRIKDAPFKIKQAEEVIDLCNKYSIPICASFMFGLPGEQESDILATRDFLLKHKGRFSISGMYLMQPVPGSKYWDECLANGSVTSELDFTKLSLDLDRDDFNWDNVLYLNEKNITLKKFRVMIRKLRTEFMNSPRSCFISRMAKRYQSREFFINLTGFENIFKKIISKSRHTIKYGERLYVGCGDDVKSGFIGCDIRPLSNVSVVCNAWEISRYCREVKEIYCRHMLEHLTLPQLEATLLDWICALENGGTITIIVPNMDYHIEQWSRAVWNEETWQDDSSDARHSFAGFWGWQRECGTGVTRKSQDVSFWDVHKCGFNQEFLVLILSRAGFRDITCKVVDNFHLVASASKKHIQL